MIPRSIGKSKFFINNNRCPSIPEHRKFSSYNRGFSLILFDRIQRYIFVIPASLAAYTAWRHHGKISERIKNDLNQEKVDQIPPVPLPQDLSELKSLAKYRVHLRGRFEHDKEILLSERPNVHLQDTFLLSHFDSAGYYVLTPMILEDGRHILVNRGWVSRFNKDPKNRILGQVEGIVEFDAYVQPQEIMSLETKFRTIVHNTFSWYQSNQDSKLDQESLVRRLGLHTSTIFVADKKSTQKAGPIGGQMVFEEEINYLTEYTNSIILLFIAYVMKFIFK